MQFKGRIVEPRRRHTPEEWQAFECALAGHHEAGHFVANECCWRRVGSYGAKIFPGRWRGVPSWGGSAWYDSDRFEALPRDERDYWELLTVDLAGGAAEARFRSCSFDAVRRSGHIIKDRLHAMPYIYETVKRGYAANAKEAWTKAEEAAKACIDAHWHSVELVAKILIRDGRIRARQVACLVDDPYESERRIVRIED